MSDTHSWKYKQVKEWMQTAAKYGHTQSSLDSIVHAINDVFASDGRQMVVKVESTSEPDEFGCVEIHRGSDGAIFPEAEEVGKIVWKTIREHIKPGKGVRIRCIDTPRVDTKGTVRFWILGGDETNPEMVEHGTMELMGKE